MAAEDHGFQVDTDSSFSSPQVISLGARDIPGRFVGETDNLDIHLDYYCRAYITASGETKIGNVLSFSTLSPRAVDFIPKEGTLNKTIILEGRNLTADTKVLWNNMEIIPDNITAETFLEFKIPAIEDTHIVHLKIVAQGDTSAFNEPFEYIVGTWNNEGQMDDELKNVRHIYFEDGDEFFYGLGITSEFIGLSPKLHVINKNTLIRTTILFNGTPAEGAFFSATYFGGGSVGRVRDSDPTLPNTSEFWKYENQSFTQLPNIPAFLYQAVAIATNGKVYVYGGEDQSRNRNTGVLVFDINSNSWSASMDAPISPLNSYPYFHLDGSNYFITEDGVTHKHDLSNDSWDTVTDYKQVPKENGISIVLNDKAYVGLQGGDRRVYEFSSTEDKWRTKKSLPDNNPFTTIGAWAHNDKIYIARVGDGLGFERVLWSFDPVDF